MGGTQWDSSSDWSEGGWVALSYGTAYQRWAAHNGTVHQIGQWVSGLLVAVEQLIRGGWHTMEQFIRLLSGWVGSS